MVGLRSNILCVLGAPNDSQPPLTPNPLETIQFIEFAYYHDRFSTTTIRERLNKYTPLIQTLRIKGWKVKSLVTIVAVIVGAIDEHPIQALEHLKFPQMRIKKKQKKTYATNPPIGHKIPHASSTIQMKT